MRRQRVDRLGKLVLAVVLIATAGGLGGAVPVGARTISSPPPLAPIPACPAFVPTPESDASPAPSPSPAPAASPVPLALPAPTTDGVDAVSPRRPRTGPLPRWDGQWDNNFPTLAIAPRTGAIVAVEPQQPHGRTYGTILWGGFGVDGRLLNDGVMIDTRGEARLLPAAPICPRRDFAWTYDWFGNAVIWGGVDQAGEPLGDGAAYSLLFGTWTVLAPSPLSPGPAIMAGDVNDLFVVTADPETGFARMANLRRNDTDDGSWEGPYDVPLPKGERYEIVHCCTNGTGWVVVFSIQPHGFAQAARFSNDYPTQGQWTQLGRVPLAWGIGGGPAIGHTTEDELTAWIRTSEQTYPGTDLTGPYGVIMRSGKPSRPWRLTAPAPEAAVGDPSLVLSPSHLISVAGMVAYDLVRDRWLRLPKRSSSPRFGTPVGATAWWNEGKLWVFGGRTPDGSMESRLWTFTPWLPPDTIALPGDQLSRYGDGCVAIGVTGTWRLRGDPDDPLKVWVQQGKRRQATHWPDGWVGRFRPDLEIVDSAGRVRYRDGDVCRTDPGTGG